MPIPARKLQLQVMHELSATVTWNTPSIATGVQIGTLPAGAVLDKTSVLTTTAFNGTTSVALSVGTALTGTQYINGTDVRTAAARVDTVVPIAQVGPLAADTPVYASVAFGGTTGSAGSSTIVLTYAPVVG